MDVSGELFNIIFTILLILILQYTHLLEINVLTKEYFSFKNVVKLI